VLDPVAERFGEAAQPDGAVRTELPYPLLLGCFGEQRVSHAPALGQQRPVFSIDNSHEVSSSDPQVVI